MVWESPTGQSSANRPMLSPEFRDESKRERLALAAGELVHDGGIGALTVDRLTERAGMARSTFYHLFDNVESCFLYACRLGSGRLRAAVEAGADREVEWRQRVRSAIESLLSAASEQPELAELCLLHGRGLANPRSGPYDPDLVAAIGGVLGEGRGGRIRPEPAGHPEEILAGGILSVVAERLWRGQASRLAELTEELASLATTHFHTT